MKHKFKIAKGWADIKEAVENCKKTKYFSHDFESSGKPPQNKDGFLTMIGISYQPYTSVVIPLHHNESKLKKEADNIMDYIGEHLVINPDIIKIAFNTKFENKWWLRYGWDYRGRTYDAMLAKYLLDEERPHDLGSIVGSIFPEFEDYKDDTAILARKHGWANIPLMDLAKRNALDTDLTLRLMLYFEHRFLYDFPKFNKIFRSMLMPASSVLSDSEYKGVCIDTKYLDGLVKSYAKKIAKTEKAVRNIPKIKKYDQYKIRRGIRELIKTTNAEIEDLLEQGKSESDRVIKNRQEKVSRYIAGELTTNKEKKIAEPVNFESPKQLIDLLFVSPKGFKLPIIEYTKDKTTKRPTETPSTGEEVLLKLQKKDKSGFINHLLDLRGLNKLNSTYVVGMREQTTIDNRIHGSFLLHGTVTGRLSSREPNLQNIPRGTTSADIKKMFIPPPGQLLLEVDYSQAELRVVAELAQDKTMIDIFKRNYNIHVATACKMNNRLDDYAQIKEIIAKGEKMEPTDLIKPENKEFMFWVKEKKKGKTLNFSILYMQSDEQTAEQMGVSVDDAARFKEDWFKSFPGIKRWMKGQEKYVRKHGYVVNMFGRKRRLDDIWSDIRGFQNKAIRDCINAPIQGTSSDFTLLSTIMVWDKVLRGEIVGITQQAYTVHDSIGYYVYPEHIHKIVKQIIPICENPETMKYFGFEMKDVSMKVSPEVGKDWADLTAYDPWENYKKWVQ